MARNMFSLRYEASVEPVLVPPPPVVPESAGWDFHIIRPFARIPTQRETIVDISWFPRHGDFAEAWDFPPSRPFISPAIPRSWIETDIAWFPIVVPPAAPTFNEAWDVLAPRPFVEPTVPRMIWIEDDLAWLFPIPVPAAPPPPPPPPPEPLSGPFIPMREFFAQEVIASATFKPVLMITAHPEVIVDGGGSATVAMSASARGIRIERVDGRAQMQTGLHSTARGRVRAGAPHVELEDAQALGLFADDNWWEALR